MSSNLLESFEKNGYVIVDNLIDPALFDRLAVAADKVTNQARAGDWVYNSLKHFQTSLLIGFC